MGRRGGWGAGVDERTHLRWPGHLTGTLKTKDQQIQHQTVVLENKRGEL